MKRFALGLTFATLAAFSVHAQGRPMSSQMLCANVQQLIAKNGAVVLGFTQFTYDRVVADQRFCLYSEVTRPIFVPTRDTRSCFAGYTCVEGGDSWSD